jgi:hypothetical protein
MLNSNKRLPKKLFLSLLLVFSLFLFAACSGSETENTNEEHSEEEEHGEHEHDTNERIANPDGAAITILSPADGATFAEGDEVLVEVEVENFALGEDGKHWHIYVDGTSWGMVMGENTSEALRGLEAGTHEIETFIAGGDHIEFEDGDSITITVE